MTSYQKLKQKCEYLQSQVDIFKNALTVVRQAPQVVEDFSQDSISLTMRTLYSIRENEINEDLKIRLNHWVASNLDKETIERLLKLKENKDE
jgi:3-dehydroquinate dehydratase